MLNLLLQMLNYVDLRSTWQAQAMEDSQMLQTQQTMSSNQQAEIMRQQAAEEQMVQMEMDSSEDLSTEEYTQALQKLSQIADKFDNMMRKVLAENEAKESIIQQRITAREPKLQAVNADIEGLQETLDKRTEEQFTYMQN